MKITKRQLRRLIKEELSMINEELLPGFPKTADEMMLKLNPILGLDPRKRTYQMIKNWVEKQYASPTDFPIEAMKIISKIIFSGGGDAVGQLLDYIKSSTGQT